jgi:GNAT superfamily N-acetyltransferase
MYFGDVPKEEPDSGIKVKSVFCFVVAPEMRHKGISKLLLEYVCKDATVEGFDFVEAYPNKEFNSERFEYMGPIKIYEDQGFKKYIEFAEGPKIIMRKELKG